MLRERGRRADTPAVPSLRPKARNASVEAGTLYAC